MTRQVSIAARLADFFFGWMHHPHVTPAVLISVDPQRAEDVARRAPRQWV